MNAPKNSTTAKQTMCNGLVFESSIGNNKLPTTTMIFNMGSATHCPADKMGLCPMGKCNGDGTCYALKAERLYPQVLPFRTRQENVWLNSTADDIVSAINEVLKTRPYINAIRVNESGDFHSIECVNKLSKVASKIQIPMYTYTHGSDLFTKKVTDKLSKNLSVNFSCDMNYKHNHNEFRLPEDVPANTKTFGCKGDCSVCSMCVKPRGIIITNAKH